MYDTDRCKCRFLLVSLKVDTILAETTIHRRRNRLNAMGDGLGLGNAYGATLERIKTQGGESKTCDDHVNVDMLFGTTITDR